MTSNLSLLLILTASSALLVPSPVHAHGAFHDRLARASASIEANAANPDHYLTRSTLYRDHGDFAAALEDLEQAAQLDPSNHTVDLLRGKLYLRWDQPEKAVVALEHFHAQQPDHPVANADLAHALARLGRSLEAARYYTRAIESAPPPNLEHYLERARALRASGREHDDAALAGLDDGMRRLGPVVALAMAAVEIEVDRGRFDTALARLDRLLARSPRHESWLAQRGDILEAAARVDEARASYRAALAEIARLPAARRRTPAIAQLESHARNGLTRLARAKE